MLRYHSRLMDPGNTKNTMKLKSVLILRNKVEKEEEYRVTEERTNCNEQSIDRLLIVNC